MAWRRLLGGVTRRDLLVGVLGTALVQWSGLVALSQSQVSGSSIGTVATTFSVPVRIVEAPRPEVPAGRLALGGGGGKGGRAAGSRATTPSADGTSAGTQRAPTQRESTGKIRQTTNPSREKKRAISFETGATNPEQPAPNEASEAVEDGSSEIDAASGNAGDATGGNADGIGAGPSGEGFPEGSIGGTLTDPLVARAIQLYRERFSAWLAARFRVKGSGLSKAELKRIKVRATVRIDEQRRVAGYSITPSGNRAFDEAAQAALRSVTGLEIPPLPSRYPGPVQQQIRVTFVCPEDACD